MWLCESGSWSLLPRQITPGVEQPQGSLGGVGSASEFEQAAAEREDHGQGHGAQGIVAGGMQKQNPDADAGRALKVGLP